MLAASSKGSIYQKETDRHENGLILLERPISFTLAGTLMQNVDMMKFSENQNGICSSFEMHNN